MDPVSLILAALAAGAVTGVGETATEAVKDAYSGLKALLSRRFRGRPDAELVLAQHEEDPDTWAKPLEQTVAKSGAADDAEVIAAAQRLLELTDPAGAKAGKYAVDLRGAQGVYVGDQGTQTNTFNAPPPA